MTVDNKPPVLPDNPGMKGRQAWSESVHPRDKRGRFVARRRAARRQAQHYKRKRKGQKKQLAAQKKKYSGMLRKTIISNPKNVLKVSSRMDKERAKLKKAQRKELTDDIGEKRVKQLERREYVAKHAKRIAAIASTQVAGLYIANKLPGAIDRGQAYLNENHPAAGEKIQRVRDTAKGGLLRFTGVPPQRKRGTEEKENAESRQKEERPQAEPPPRDRSFDNMGATLKVRNPEEFDTVSANVLGAPLTDDGIMALAGNQAGRVTATTEGTERIGIELLGKQVYSSLDIEMREGEPVMKMHGERVFRTGEEDDVFRSLMATRMQACKNVGIEKVQADVPQGESLQYARMGFDMDFQHHPYPRKWNHPDYSRATSLQDLLKMDGGERFWEEHGGEGVMEFDARAGSSQWKQLAQYLRKEDEVKRWNPALHFRDKLGRFASRPSSSGKGKGKGRGKSEPPRAVVVLNKEADSIGSPVRAGLSAISQAHKVDSSFPKVSVKLRDKIDNPTAEGLYRTSLTFKGGVELFTPGSDPSKTQMKPGEIQIKKAGVHPANTFTHEFGHYLDNCMSTSENGRGYASEDSPEFKGWRNAIAKTNAVQYFQQAHEKGDERAKYYMSTRELWARSYSRWVQERSQGTVVQSEEKKDQEKLKQMQNKRDSAVETGLFGPELLAEIDRGIADLRAVHFRDDDFEPVAAEIDKIFKKRGWMKMFQGGMTYEGNDLEIKATGDDEEEKDTDAYLDALLPDTYTENPDGTVEVDRGETLFESIARDEKKEEQKSFALSYIRTISDLWEAWEATEAAEWDYAAERDGTDDDDASLEEMSPSYYKAYVTIKAQKKKKKGSAHWEKQPRDERGRFAKLPGSSSRQQERSATVQKHKTERSDLRKKQQQEREDLKARHKKEKTESTETVSEMHQRQLAERKEQTGRHMAERSGMRSRQGQERETQTKQHQEKRAQEAKELLEQAKKENPKAMSVAFGTDPNRRFEMKHKVVDLEGEIKASNTEAGGINPDYDSRLQPRDRSRAASRLQILQMSKKMVPEAMVVDFHQLDKGSPIVDSDGNVLSGNGRTLALQTAKSQNKEKWDEYQNVLRDNLEEHGLTEKDLEGKKAPVLVRELMSDVDRVAFAQEANQPPVLQMSPLERAKGDANNLTAASLETLSVKEGVGIDVALRRAENRAFVKDFVGTLPENERAAVLRGDGSISKAGIERVKAALFTKTFPGESGSRLAETFLEAVDSDTKSIETGIAAALPSMAKVESDMAEGVRDPSLSLAGDFAEAIKKHAEIKEKGWSVEEYLGQMNMFGSSDETVGKDTTQEQDQLLSWLHENARRPKVIREKLEEYSRLVGQQPPLSKNELGSDRGDRVFDTRMTREELMGKLFGGGQKEEQTSWG